MKLINVVLVCVLVIANIQLLAKSEAAIQDSVFQKVQELDESLESITEDSYTSEIGDYGLVNDWFLKTQIELENETYPNDQIKLKYVYHTDCDLPLYNQYGLFGLGVHYSLPLHTLYGSIGYRYALDAEERFGISPLLLFGSGMNEIEELFPTRTETVSLLIGAGIELSWRPKNGKWEFVLPGLNLLNVNTESSIDNPKHTGATVPVYVAGRYFLIKKYLAVDLQLGILPIWNFGDVNSDTYFLSAGLVSYPFSFQVDGNVTLMPIEGALVASAAREVLNAKIGIPLRLSKSSSIAVTTRIGTGTTRNGLADDITDFRSVGLEYRCFADRMRKVLNPYVGFAFDYLDYESGSHTAQGTSLTVGNKSRLYKNLYLDLYYSPLIFWQDSDWPINRVTGADIDVPAMSDLGAGLAYQFHMPARTYGTIRVVNDEALRAKLNDENFIQVVKNANGPIEANARNGSFCETRVFSQAPVDTVTVTKVEVSKLGDVTDIKFFEVKLDMNVSISQKGPDDFNPTEEINEERTMIVALFDNDKVDVQAIKDSIDMHLHFMDVVNNRYFGYRWDRNRIMRPEHRKLNIPITRTTEDSNPLYYGYYKDYVREMRWLDEATDIQINGVQAANKFLEALIFKELEKTNPMPIVEGKSPIEDVLRTSDPTPKPKKNNGPKTLCSDFFCMAYAQYPNEVIDNIRAAFGNDDAQFALTLLFKGKNSGNPDFATVNYDPGFFSNHVIAKEVLTNDDPVFNPSIVYTSYGFNIIDFPLGKAQLSDKQVEQMTNDIKEAMRKKAARSNSKITLKGYADKTEFRSSTPEDNVILNRQLSQKRAEYAQRLIASTDLDLKNVEAVGEGIDAKSGENDPEARRVEVHISN